MSKETNKLKLVWDTGKKTAIQKTVLPEINFNNIISNIVSLGPYYSYIIDFFDGSISHVSPSIQDIHGFDPETVTLDDIINSIHPDDMDFVAKAEESNINFLFNTIGKEQVLNYKTNYSFRSRMKNGEYAMLNHQAILLTLDDNGRFGKSLNIHTVIDHITKTNSFTFSLIGLQDHPSYTDIKVCQNINEYIAFSTRELEVIKLIYSGLSTKEIALALSISEHTIKTHRKNIYKKSNCKNVSELIHRCIASGLI
ncbi:LuxR C-terminal-related transcriptional regulator [Flavobacterium sp. NG2]|uniref:LuxR C-terminal-related transcriptional regulator n=1 Tax=Flavobacterium sp. NG2 TaxID=3097547 RepID=UPI002A7F7FC0|nr:LuxR C-terminal-related transcriptional regulator [Flavobacterium sp. NG2]WPR70293.1 LuxR C-terminal-related transcriptional regulator [Flavobacterium sp. NG2]